MHPYSCPTSCWSTTPPLARKLWRTMGATRVIRMAQARAERLARFNRRQVLRSDGWMDQSLPF